MMVVKMYIEFDEDLGCDYAYVQNDNFYWEGPVNSEELDEIYEKYKVNEVDEDEFYSEDDEEVEEIEVSEDKVCTYCGGTEQLIDSIIENKKCYACISCIMKNEFEVC